MSSWNGAPSDGCPGTHRHPGEGNLGVLEPEGVLAILHGTRVAPGSWFGEDKPGVCLGFGHLDAWDFTETLARLGNALR